MMRGVLIHLGVVICMLCTYHTEHILGRTDHMYTEDMMLTCSTRWIDAVSLFFVLQLFFILHLIYSIFYIWILHVYIITSIDHNNVLI